MVEVTNALQPLPQREWRIVPLDLGKEIDTMASGLRRKSPSEKLCNDLLGGEVEDRMRVQVGGKYIPAIADLQNLGLVGKLHKHFDGGILQGTDHDRDPGPGLKSVRDEVNMISDFHAF
jgi:hypothetical protein